MDEDEEVLESMKPALGVLEQSGNLKHLHLINDHIPITLTLPVAQSCKNLQTWSSWNYSKYGFKLWGPVVEAQKESLEMVEIVAGSSNDQMFPVISKCSKLKTLILHAEDSSSFSILGLDLLSNLTTLEIKMPAHWVFEDEDFPAANSLPNMKRVKVETTIENFSFVVSLAIACQNLQSFEFVSSEKAVSSDQVDQILRRCPNIEILKLATKYTVVGAGNNDFENLSVFCPKILFLQWKNGEISNRKTLMQKNRSLIAIESTHGLSVDSGTKYEEIGDVLSQLEASFDQLFAKIEFY